MVVVKGRCTRLTKDHLEYTIETTPSLRELPFFHMFWTECQVLSDCTLYILTDREWCESAYVIMIMNDSVFPKQLQLHTLKLKQIGPVSISSI